LPLASAPPHPQTGPAVKTAAGRVFYGGGGITPDIDVKPLNATPLRQRIAESAFYFTRQLSAGLIPGLEAYKVEKVIYGRSAKLGDYPITDKVVEAFREFVRNDSLSGFTAAQLEQEMDFVKLRLREEIITAAFSNDAGARVLLDSDPQVLRAIEALPDAKRLAETARNNSSQG
jgi:carboxyl-terminal processing protease